MTKSRWQRNILQNFREIVTPSSFICLKKLVFYVNIFRLLPSFIYFLFVDLYNILN